MPIGHVIGFILSILIGVLAGLVIYVKWKWPRRWIEFYLLLAWLVLIPFYGINRGTHFFWMGDSFDLRAGGIGYGAVSVLAITFLLTQYARRRLAGHSSV